MLKTNKAGCIFVCR